MERSGGIQFLDDVLARVVAQPVERISLIYLIMLIYFTMVAVIFSYLWNDMVSRFEGLKNGTYIAQWYSFLALFLLASAKGTALHLVYIYLCILHFPLAPMLFPAEMSAIPAFTPPLQRSKVVSHTSSREPGLLRHVCDLSNFMPSGSLL